jgi:gliding motility-associated-like protein
MKHYFLFILFTILFFTSSSERKSFLSNNIFKTNFFIENNGQYDHLNHTLSPVDFAIQHQQDEIYISSKGFTFHINTTNQKNEDELISFEWQNHSSFYKAVSLNKTSHYFTFGDAAFNSYGYEKVIYKNLYKNIDVCYELNPKGGLEYTLILHPNADLSQVKFKYSSNTYVEVQNNKSSLSIQSKYSTLVESSLKAYYVDGTPVEINYSINNQHEISFKPTKPIQHSKKLIIDPWVSNTNTLLGATATLSNMGYDVDYDVLGNLFVLGGGGGINSTTTAPKLAKYDISGNLVWTFIGSLVVPNWNTSPYATNGIYGSVGNFIVDKISSKVYLSQGYNPVTGATVIRLDNNGVYDNFISTPNNQIQSICEMKFNCTNGNVIAMGGSSNSNLNFGIINPQSGIVSTSAVSGAGGLGQYVICSTLDLNGEVFLIFASNGTPAINNKIFKLTPTYAFALWSSPSGFNTFVENDNKPYTGLTGFSNSFNCLSVNNSYLFYYDGLNLAAYDKNNGLPVGTPLQVSGYMARMQGGIYSNNCNEVFIGGNNGNILRYVFNGNSFTIQDTIQIAGQNNKAIYDISNNPINNLLYITGNGFVAAVDPNTTCAIAPAGNIQLTSNIICPDSAYVTITNPDLTSGYTFIWTDSTTNTSIQTNVVNTGTFSNGITGLITGHTYKVTVLKPSSCQIISNNISFIFSCGVINVTVCPGQSYTLSNNTIITSPGLYTDTLLNSFNQDSIIYINFTNHPIYNDTINASICNGNSYLLPNGSSVNTAGNYISNLTTSFGCDSIITTILTLANNTTSSATATICSNKSYTLPSGTIVNTSGIYIDTINNTNGCDSIITTNLIVTQLPTISLGKDTTLCNNESITVDITTLNANYSWNDNTIAPVRTINEKGIYIATVSLPPCELVKDTLIVSACQCDVFIPNAFSPNGDMKNDIFKPTFKCITPPDNYILKIFNRWGEEIFYTKLQDDGWDGTYRFVKQDIGTYMYYLKYIDPNTTKETIYKGEITLVQ